MPRGQPNTDEQLAADMKEATKILQQVKELQARKAMKQFCLENNLPELKFQKNEPTIQTKKQPSPSPHKPKPTLGLLVTDGSKLRLFSKKGPYSPSSVISPHKLNKNAPVSPIYSTMGPGGRR